jgi:hypothetical protein
VRAKSVVVFICLRLALHYGKTINCEGVNKTSPLAHYVGSEVDVKWNL